MRPRGRGQALIEFAVVIGIVVILAVGAIQSLYTFYLLRQVRAAAEEIADLAATQGGDTPQLRQGIPEILRWHRLDPELADVTIDPVSVRYLDPVTVTLTYSTTVRFYGLFDLVLPPQRVLRLSEGG